MRPLGICVSSPAPIHAAMTPPVRRPNISTRKSNAFVEPRKPSLATAEIANVARLISRLMRTALCANNANTPIKIGRRNSAPPRPISPPSMATAAPALAAAKGRRIG